MIYIGIDIAKFKHTACITDQYGKILLQPFDFNNNQQGFNLFLDTIKPFMANEHLFGLESTGHYGDNVINMLLSHNYKVALINPLVTDAQRKLNIRKTKNDKIDTKVICDVLRSSDKYTMLTNKDIALSELRSLCRFRHDLVKECSEAKTKLTGCLDIVFPEYSKLFSTIYGNTSLELLSIASSAYEIANLHLTKLTNLLKSFSKGRLCKVSAIKIKELANNSIGTYDGAVSFRIKQLIVHIKLLKSQIEELELKIQEINISLDSKIFTIPGIGPIIGAIILSELGNISRFSHPNKMIAYAGCDPKVYQSGNFNASTCHLSKRGSSYLRYAIFQAALHSYQNNATLGNYYNKKRSEGKSHYCVLGHLTHKLFRIIFHILNENEDFNLD